MTSKDENALFLGYENKCGEDYEKKDIYGRLQFIRGMCRQCIARINNISGSSVTYNFAGEIIENLEAFLPLFSKDINDNEEMDRTFRDIGEILPLIRSWKTDPRYLIVMLRRLMDEVDARLPNNLKLARFLDSLIDHGEEISALCGVDATIFIDTISKMKANSDSISGILETPEEKIVTKRTRR